MMNSSEQKTNDEHLLDYSGWDVHAYTRQWCDSINKHGWDFSTSVPLDQWQQLIWQLKHVYFNIPDAMMAIDKMDRRYLQSENGRYLDTDLPGPCNVGRLLLETWTLVLRTRDPDTVVGFGRTILTDIGGTCIQGDSHRLLTYYAALFFDARDNKK